MQAALVSDSGAQTLSPGRIGGKRLERENPAGNGMKVFYVPENIIYAYVYSWVCALCIEVLVRLNPINIVAVLLDLSFLMCEISPLYL